MKGYNGGKVTNKGQFFPFDELKEIDSKNTNSSDLNHFFGMHLRTYFYQENNGYTDDTSKSATEFHFSGDDDVWIFIDNILVADLGGIHNAASVDINFVTGDITYKGWKDSKENNYESTSNLGDIFTAVANLESNSDKKESILASLNKKVEGSEVEAGKTLKNLTGHTLDFFYLERGGNESNITLRYNLHEVPVSSIYKIDQYGLPLKDAGFAVYEGKATTENGKTTYKYVIDQKDASGNVVKVDVPLENNWKFAKDVEGENHSEDWLQKWNIVTSDGKVIPCKFYGKSDDKGEMIFQNANGSLMTFNEMKNNFGQEFILREVEVPPGYRTVSDEGWFRFDDMGVMLCDSTYTAGLWAENHAQITAIEALLVAKEYEKTLTDMNLNDIVSERQVDIKTDTEQPKTETRKFINYYDKSMESGTGTLFAVVLKRNQATNPNDYNDWIPVYGNNVDGYQMQDDDTHIKNVIKAAQEQKKMTGDASVIFEPIVDGGILKYRLLMEHLPGKIERYSSYIRQKYTGEELTEQLADPTKLQYKIALYWTNGSLDDAAPENTVRIDSDIGGCMGDTELNNFDCQYGTKIEVPNMENRLFVQKRKTENSSVLVDGAVFALYEAHDQGKSGKDSDKLVYYVGYSQTNPTKKVFVIPYVKGVDGYDEKDPYKVAVFTESKDDLCCESHENEMKSHFLGVGHYKIAGSDSTLQVELTNGAITNQPDDLGNLVVTMDPNGWSTKLNDISQDNLKTYQDTYGETMIVEPARNADGEKLVGVTHDSCASVSEPGTAHFGKLKTGEYVMREIVPPHGYKLNNADVPVIVTPTGVYAYAGDADNNIAVGNGIGYLSKTVDVFASENEIDNTLTWVYGLLLRNNVKGFAAFKEIAGDQIDFDVGKGWYYVEADNDKTDGFGSDKNITEKRDALTQYYKYDQSVGHADSEDKRRIFDYLPNDVMIERKSTNLTGENNALRLWSKTGWTDLAIYQDYEFGNSQDQTGTKTYYEDISDLNLSNLFSSSTFVSVSDEFDREIKIDVDVNKFDLDDKTQKLTGAKFRLYRLEDEKKFFYSYNETTKETTWVEETETEKGTYIMPDSDEGTSEIHFSYVDGKDNTTYYLEETEAPGGYNLLTAPIEIELKYDLDSMSAEMKFRYMNKEFCHYIPDQTTTQAETPKPVDIKDGFDVLNIHYEDQSLESAIYKHIRTYSITLNVPNQKGYVLPATGGIGTEWYQIAGFVMITLSLILFVGIQERKRKNKNLL